MTSSTYGTREVALRPELFSSQEELALAGFLAGYSSLTREAYMLDLRQYVTWCAERRVALFGARRADIEAFGRHLETAGELEPRSRDGSARSPASTGTPNKRTSSRSRRRCMSVARNSTTNRMPPDWIAMRSGPCSSPPVSASRMTTP